MISFVITTYNSEKTIERAINSILEQKTNLEYEIIVVDDGSNDDTKVVLAKYYDKIKYYYKKNEGVAIARNFGVENAKGEYIIFIDSDDYIKNTLLQDIETYILQKIDLIKWNPLFVYENKKESLEETISVEFDKATGEDGFNFLFGKDNLIDCLWRYAIKKELIPKFPEEKYHEDFATIPFIILKAKSFVSINKFEYYYVQSENSIMRNSDVKKTRKKLQDKLFHFDNIVKNVDALNLKETTKENVKIWATNSILVSISNLDDENKKYLNNEFKKRNISKYIKIRNIKQILKKLYLKIKY